MSNTKRSHEEETHLRVPQNEDDDYNDLPPPPDGGYGWVIVAASFMCNMVVDGISYTFGIFLTEIVKDYGETKGNVAWVGSILTGMTMCAGPIVSALANKFGCRTVCIVGSLISTAAFALSIFSPNVVWLMLTYGFVGGTGFGLIYLPAVVCVGYYFESKRSLATGIAVCGSGVGTFAFAPLATILLQIYGWKGANLILAGMILNCVIFGALMRPLEYPAPPDGGYGWVIVAASFVCNMVVDGIAYTFGMFLFEIINYYNESKGKTAWVGSILTGTYLIIGPLVGALCNKFGCRAVCVAGSIISTVAFALSIFSPTVNWLMFTYGFLGGFGFGLIYLPAVVCVGYYFESKRSLATGIAVCGSGAGTFAFAPLATILLDRYGWKGANLILAVTAGFISLSSIILVDLVGLDKLTNAFGLLTFYRGAAALIGTPLAGTLYDMTQSYELPFFVAASLFGLAAITSFTAPLLKRTSNKNIETNDVLTPINEENEV